ncbi:MAG: glutamate--tRNA ligase [Campylobacteraceae bacterium]|jgi:glutamyl-tRNA synthetase|nr:glutamate--tRNA ligase [Campylobacteraceae bacterium]
MYRFAPSPTGDMHIGNLRAAIFNFICAKKSNKGFYIRIEDTDTTRNIEGKDKEILEILNVFDITYENLYYQSKNLRFHQQLAMQLVGEKKAFVCFCTEEEIEAKREKAKRGGVAYRYDNTCLNLSDEEVLTNEKPFVVRLKQPTQSITFSDDIKGVLTFEPKDIDSFVILRHNKTPMYNFACAVDDMLENTTDIIRGEDHVSNTPKQEHIRISLGYTQKVNYAHLPIILNHEGKKMSKRDDASSVKWLLEEGFLPRAIANYLILLGNKAPHEIFTMEEAIEWFDIKKVAKSPAKFDIDKLRQINREHLRRLSDKEFANLMGFKDENIGKIGKLYTEEGSSIKEIEPKVKAIFAPKIAPQGFEKEFDILKSILQNVPYFEEFDDFKAYLFEESSLKGKEFFKPLRALLTNSEHGPELAALYPVIKTYIKEIAR